MKPFSSISIAFIVLLFSSCELDRIESQPLVEDTRSEQVFIQKIDFRATSYKWSNQKSYTQQFVYHENRLKQIQQIGDWVKEYNYKNGLLTSRITLDWQQRDTLQIDSFIYHEVPIRLKQKKELRIAKSGKKTEHIFTYYHNPEGKLIKIVRQNIHLQRQNVVKAEWYANNPLLISHSKFSDLDKEPELYFNAEYTYDEGLNYQFFRRWDPDVIKPKHNFTKVYAAGPTFDSFGSGFDQQIEYNAQGYPERIYQIYCTSCHWIDTLELFY